MMDGEKMVKIEIIEERDIHVTVILKETDRERPVDSVSPASQCQWSPGKNN